MTYSWYSINITLKNGGEIFYGYFKVDDNTNLVTAFYENINGYTDFNNNILIPTGTGVPYGTYLSFTTYDDGFAIYDNAYLSNWIQFDHYGVIINSMSTYPEFNEFNLRADKIGHEVVDNIGIIHIHPKSEKCLFYINPISDPSCFNEGTKILCLNKNFEEEYIPIENLRKGNLVKTYKHGYRKIDLIGVDTIINNPSKFHTCMFKLKKTQENGLIDDLIVTGGHSILVEDLGIYKEINDKIFGTTPMITTPMIEDKYLLLCCVSKDFEKIENINLYNCYNFILENNQNDNERFGVWANGILVEIPSKNQFLNHKYENII